MNNDSRSLPLGLLSSYLEEVYRVKVFFCAVRNPHNRAFPVCLQEKTHTCK